MPRGRVGNQTYTGFNAASDTQLRKLRLSDRSEPNRQNRKIPPSQESMRRAVAAGMCPFCGDQFKNIAGHTNRTHGVTADELKEMIGVPKTHPVCAPELSQRASDAQKKANRDMEEIRSHRKHGKRKLSEAGRLIQTQKLENWREDSGDDGQSQRLSALRSALERRNEEYSQKFEEAFKLISEGYLLKDVARHVGVHHGTLSRRYREAHPGVDLRSVRHQAKRLNFDS